MRRALIAIVAAGCLALGVGGAVDAIARSQPAVSEGRAESIALRWTHGGDWTVAGAHVVSARRHFMWFPYETTAWEIDLVSPRGQAQVVVDRRDGTVLAATEETA